MRKAKDYIRAGEIYQVNLSHRLTISQKLDPWEFHSRLTQSTPAPFSAYIVTGDCILSSVSPELFLKIDGRRIETRPIKGTRPRGNNALNDSHQADELKQSPKENAELIMITDLLRNDLGRICQYGSIHVSDLARLEIHPQVLHLVSTIEGQMRPEMSALGALAACFPGGSITGAPKIRAMDIIDELEPVQRGPYTGSIGYAGFNQRSQWNIVIRTAILHRRKIHFQVGAGIVADSNPELEYEETLHKARGFLQVFSKRSAED